MNTTKLVQNKSIKLYEVFMVMMYISSNGAMLEPAYAYYFHGTKTTMTNTKVPFTEKESIEEFVINFVLTCVIDIHGFIGYIGLEVTMALFSDVVTIVPKLVAHKFQKLNEQYQSHSITKHQLCFYFKNIIKQPSDSDEYDSFF